MKPKNVVARFAGFVLVCQLFACPSAPSCFSKNTNIVRANVSGVELEGRVASARRRPRTCDVVHYVIRTSFDVSSKTVFGEVDVVLKPLSSGFHLIELDAANLQVESVTLASGDTLTFLVKPTTLQVSLDRAYDPTDNVSITIKYKARPTRGLYFIASNRENGISRPAHIWTQGEPEDNHHWFPCYDFPDDKATSEQYITTGSNEIAIANGTLIDVANNPNGTRTFHWQMGQPHSTYLISLIVGNYVSQKETYKNIQLEYYTYPGTEAQARRAFGSTPQMIDWFTKVLNFQFPYDRYAQTVVGDFIFGGMENITATTFADSDILTPDKDSPDATVDLVSHELAHSWFGDLVTCKDWSNLWLNEGFSTFMEASFREHQSGRGAYLSALQKDAKDYFQDDPSREHHPLVNPNYPLSMRLFDATTYKKGAFVVHMLRETVGDEVFWNALNIYLHEYKYKTVDSGDLQRVFERESGQSLAWFFDQWVYKAGFPQLVIRSQYSGTKKQLTLNVSQTQKIDGLTPSAFRLSMEVEIITASGSRTERISVARRSQDFTFQVDSKPLSITVDKRASVLKKMTVSQPRAAAYMPILDGADSYRSDLNARIFRDTDSNSSLSAASELQSKIIDNRVLWARSPMQLWISKH